MARVITLQDGDNHIIGSPRTTFTTLCGICDDPANGVVQDTHEGKVTCAVCREAAYHVFLDCKKSEVK